MSNCIGGGVIFMGNYVYFYNVAICNEQGEITDRCVKEFLEKVEKLLEKDERKVARIIGDDAYSVFSYSRNLLDNRLLVVPVGKLKAKEKPWVRDVNDPKKLVPLPMDLYDINSVVYHDTYKIMMYTVNRSGPQIGDLVEYLNTFLDEGYGLKIEPIIIDTGLVKLRKADKIRNITFTLDLSGNLEKLYVQRINNEKTSALAVIKSFIKFTKNDVGSNSMKFTLSVGQKGDTLDKKAILDLLGYMDLNSEYIKEIEFNYKDSSTEKVTPGKIKKSFFKLSGTFKTAKGQLSPEYLKENAKDMFIEKRDYYSIEVDKFYKDCIQDEGEYEINEKWGSEMIGEVEEL